MPVDFEGLLASPISNATHHGFDQRSGNLSVADIASGERDTSINAGVVHFDWDTEASDVQDVFFTHLTPELAKGGSNLESGREPRVHRAIDGHGVTPVA